MEAAAEKVATPNFPSVFVSVFVSIFLSSSFFLSFTQLRCQTLYTAASVVSCHFFILSKHITTYLNLKDSKLERVWLGLYHTFILASTSKQVCWQTFQFRIIIISDSKGEKSQLTAYCLLFSHETS